MQEDLRAAVLSYTANPAYKPAKPKIIAERLGLAGEAAAELKKVVKKMIRAGELEYGPSHKILPVDEDHPCRAGIASKTEKASSSDGDSAKPKAARQKDSDRYVVGTFRRVSTGEGYLRPEGTPASAGKDNDVYLSKRNAEDAASGDKIRVVLSRHAGPKGKPEGKLVDIIERATNQFVGTYLEKEGQGLVKIDGKVFSTPLYVGDPGAKGAQEDDKVVVEMVRFPSHLHEGEGVIVKILGSRGEPGVDTLSIKYEYGLPGEFPEDVMASAREQADNFDESVTGHRQDLTGDTVITIDPVDARDFDDAISLKRIENGHWLLGVHIADVSHFVPTKTPLDNEAYNRATSVYLPDEVIPMLPEIISNNLASLQPDKVRYAMTARIEFSPEGVPIGADVFKSAIKSCRRFTYEEVDEFLEDRAAWKEKLTPPVHQLLGEMHELAMTLRRRRFERGALELHMPEMKIDLDKEGRVTGAHLAKNTESHQMIEEFMLAANEAVARKLHDAGLFFLRRVHGTPDPRKMKLLTDFVRDLGLPAENLENRFELQELLNRVQGDPRQHAVNFATLRSMQRAIYSPEEEGHYALASECYCHFTSPIRRYPDLTIHRLLDALHKHEKAGGPKPVQEMAAMLQRGDHCSEREQRATNAERELKKVKLLNFFADKIGMELDGVITGVESFGLFIAGNQIPAEGFVHISALGDDYYKFDRATHSVNGFRSGNAYRLGDQVRVAVAAVNVDSRELDFRLLGRTGKAPNAAQGKKGRTGGKSRGASASKKGGSKHGGKKGGKPPKGRSDKTGKHRRKRKD